MSDLTEHRAGPGDARSGGNWRCVKCRQVWPCDAASALVTAWATVAATPWPPSVVGTPCPGHSLAGNPWRFDLALRVASADAYWNDRQRRYLAEQQVRG